MREECGVVKECKFENKEDITLAAGRSFISIGIKAAKVI